MMPGVAEAFAVAYGNPREPELGLVLRAQREIPEWTVREHFRASLPPHMMPKLVLAVTSLPVSANGKVDRKALAEQLLLSDLRYLCWVNQVAQRRRQLDGTAL
jgi:acyl-coenzyme A synthetase/AMP-(fatty) acid ligase